MVIPWSISSFLIGPCLIVMLLADGSTLVTCPSINSDWARASCDPAQSTNAEARTATFFIALSFSVIRHGFCLAARLDHRDLDGRASRRGILGTTRGLVERALVFMGNGAL